MSCLIPPFSTVKILVAVGENRFQRAGSDLPRLILHAPMCGSFDGSFLSAATLLLPKNPIGSGPPACPVAGESIERSASVMQFTITMYRVLALIAFSCVTTIAGG